MAEYSNEENMKEYVRKELSQHTPPDTIIQNMTAGGWPTDEVKKIISLAQKSRSAPEEIHSSTYTNKKHHHHIVRSVLSLIILAVIGFLTIAYMLGGP